MSARENYEEWLESPYFDEKTKIELKEIEGDEAQIEDRFYKDLEFGTGGLRGVIGAGTNRMNIYTVRKATQGLANYIIKELGSSGRGGKDGCVTVEIRQQGILRSESHSQGGIRSESHPQSGTETEKKDAGAPAVAIAYDSRHMSKEFADEAACCLAANGILAWVFPSLRPTPMLSFALRELGCIAGIVVTASHNPPEYNGYKVYWEDGAQITAPRDQEIIREVNAITDYALVKTMEKAEAEKQGLYRLIGAEIDARYMAELKKLGLEPDIVRAEAKKLKIVYTPLHGTGNLPVRRILKELGFTQVYVVKEQELPDGDFPTVSYPNPEDAKAFALALKLAKEVDADVVLATDPDADRLGIYAKDAATGEYMSFTGNMSGMLIMEYRLSRRKAQGRLPENGAMVTTIVSGKMSKAVAEAYGVKRIETLTGFKYIGEQIKFFEQEHTFEYLFGYEESYGCLVGTYARDKDAVSAVMALCEAAAWYHYHGLTLCDQMRNLYRTYGYYREGLCTVTLKGQDGARKIKAIMENVRASVPEKIGGAKVTQFRDYRENLVLDCETGVRTASGLPKSDVLYFELEGGAWCCVRPSGTEPKIKFYIGVVGNDEDDAAEKLENMTAAVQKLAE